MKFFYDILNNPQKAEETFDKKIDSKAIKNAYKAGKATADDEYKSEIKPSL